MEKRYIWKKEKGKIMENSMDYIDSKEVRQDIFFYFWKNNPEKTK